MASQSATPRSRKAPSLIVATVEALGGFTVLLTKRHKIVYASQLAESLLAGASDLSAQPDLMTVAEEAWASGEHIVRPSHLTALGPFQEVVIQAAVIQDSWILLSVTDRTEEVQAMQIRQDFVSNIGHELRTPVTSVGLIAQALHSCATDPQAVEHFAQRLERVAQRLEHLADGMLDLAQIPDSQSGRSVQPLEVDDLVERAVSQAMEAARIKGVKLRTKKHVGVQVIGDEEALTTAIENLVSNAIYYSPKGSRVSVSSQTDEAEGTVSIHVIDQGIGIAPDEQERIFERFYRTDQARSRRAGGTGLGLSIVRHTALSHGGTVSVDSQPGSGSTFTLTLPTRSSSPIDQGAREDAMP